MKNVVTLAALTAAAALSMATQSQAATLTYNSSIAGSGQTNSVDYFSFSTVANDFVTIETFTANFDSVLYLFRDTGNGLTSADYITMNDDGGEYSNNPYGYFNSFLNLELDTGDYITAVADFQLSLNEAINGINDSSALGAGYGDYRLVVSGLSVLDPNANNGNNSGNNNGSSGNGSGNGSNSNGGSGNGSNSNGGNSNGGGTGTGGSGGSPIIGVSEPMTLSFFGLALAGFGALRRKKS